MQTLGDLTNDNLDRLESDIQGYTSSFRMNKHQRDGLLGIASARLGMTTDQDARNSIIDRTRGYISGMGGDLSNDRQRQMGVLAGLANNTPTKRFTSLANSPTNITGPTRLTGRLDPNTNWVGPQLQNMGDEGLLRLATGGAIPGPVDPATGDDTTIRAKRGEYVLPVEVVQALGLENIDQMVAQVKAGLGKNPVEHMQPHQGKETGGLIDPQEQAFQQRVDQLQAQTQPQQPPNYTIPGLSNAQNIVATIDNGDTLQPVVKGNEGYALGSDLTPQQGQSLATAWNLQNQQQTPPAAMVDYQKPGGAHTITLSTSDAKGIMPTLYHPAGGVIPAGLAQADFQKRADMMSIRGANPGLIVDVDKGLVGTSGQMLTDPTSKADLLDNKLQSALEIARMRGDNAREIAQMRDNSAWQRAMLKAAKGGGRDSKNVTVNGISDTDASIIQRGIEQGRIDPTKINSRTAKIYSQMERAGGGNTNYVGAGANVKYQTLAGNLQSRALVEGISPLYDKLLAEGKALGNSNYAGINKVKNWLREQTGDPQIVGFNNLRDDVIAESERVLMGSGVLSDSKYLRAVKNVNSAQSYPQLKAAVNNLRQVVKVRSEALNAKPFQNRVANQGRQSNAPNKRPPLNSIFGDK